MISLRAATLTFTFFSNLQATNEVPLRLVFIISGIRGMTCWWVDSDDVTVFFCRQKFLT